MWVKHTKVLIHKIPLILFLYSVGFRNSVNSAEDAKSEVMKLFQESWERDNGYFHTDDLPPTTNYAQDILRNK